MTSRWPSLDISAMSPGRVYLSRERRWVTTAEADAMEPVEAERIATARAAYLAEQERLRLRAELAREGWGPPCGGCHYSCCRYCGTD